MFKPLRILVLALFVLGVMLAATAAPALARGQQDESPPLAPGAFSKTYPVNGVTDQLLSPTLQWNSSIGAVSYAYCLWTGFWGSCPDAKDWIPAGLNTSVSLRGLAPGTNYKWQVRAVDSLGGTTLANGGTTWSFTTGNVPGAFGKISPADGATGQLPVLSLSWAASSGASSYQYCIFQTLTWCNSDANWIDVGTATSKYLSGLSPNTSYRWNVRAVNDFGKTGADGGTSWVFTTGSAPGSFNRTAPSNGAANQASDVWLEWTSSSGAAEYDLCWSQATPCQSWTNMGLALSAHKTGLAPNTTYYWHVQAANSWGETYANSTAADWSFRTGGVPGTFGKSGPTNGASNQPPNPTLTWGTSANTASYSYCYGTTNPCSNWSTPQAQTSVTLSGLSPNTLYYWQVKATNGWGDTYANASAGATWTFHTGIAPVSFNKSLPANGATDQPPNPALSWYGSPNATSYSYCYGTANPCSNWSAPQTESSVTLSGLLPNSTYYWQVKATNGWGDTYAGGSLTATSSFTTGGPPGAFGKLLPGNATAYTNNWGSVFWQASPNASSYSYCVTTVPCNTSSIWIDTTFTSESFSVQPTTTYYCQVKATNGWGVTYADGSLAASWSFTTQDLPRPFSKTSPANGATDQPPNPTLHWSTSTYANNYDYCYGTTNPCSPGSWVHTASANTSVGLSSLLPNTTYYWEVNATNWWGTLNGDGAWSFTTGAPPGAFSKSGPANGAINQPPNPTLSWGTSANATSYSYCYGTTSPCSNWSTPQTQASAALSGLSRNTTYYWQVKATSSWGTAYADGSEGATRSFTTGGPPGAFSKVSPANGATNVEPFAELWWGASTNATSYYYCIGTVPCSASSTWSNTAYTWADFEPSPNSTYYWQVRACNVWGCTDANGGANWSFTGGGPPGTFSKSWPANGAANQPPNLALTWGTSSGEAQYSYCYSTTNPCSNWSAPQTATTVTLTGLSQTTTYYWQVRACNDWGCTSANGATNWSFATGGPPGAFRKSAPANGATGIYPHPTLSWGASANAASYSYCIGQMSPCSNWGISLIDTSVQIPNTLMPGSTYYWQVRATNAWGETYANGSVAATWSFTTGGPPGAFSKSGPANGVANQPPNPTLSWGTSANVGSYSYCYGTANPCSDWIPAAGSASVTLPRLLANTIYYWQVKADNAWGTTYADGGQSATRWFTTGGPPGVFFKAAPSTGAPNQPPNPTLIWGWSTNVTSFSYCYSTSNPCTGTWTAVGTDARVELPGLSPSLSPNTTYYWQVKADNVWGTTYANAEQTATWHFTTGAKPGAFNKTAPANGATGQPADPTLTWSGSARATDYAYCYGTAASCNPTQPAGTSTTVQISGLSQNTSYRWHVRASNVWGSTDANDSATAWSFTTGGPPGAFGKSAPGDNATKQPSNPTLSWGASAGATVYSYCYDRIESWPCGDYIDVGGNTQVELSNLSPGTAYVWHARAWNSFGFTYSNGGTDWAFSTGAPPGAFSKSGPASGATNQPPNPTLSWAASPNATGYSYCYGTINPCSDWILVEPPDHTSVTLSGLEKNTTYYWQVKATSAWDTVYADGTQNATRSFTTGGPPGAFNKSGPANGVLDQPTDPLLSWTASANATGYSYCYGTSDPCAAWSEPLTGTSVQLSGLSPNTTYYWQVRATNAWDPTYANGGQAANWSFTTGSWPAPFTKAGPGNGSIIMGFETILTWHVSAGALSYEYCYYDTAASPCDDAAWVSSAVTSVAVSGLSPHTTYNWQVRAVNASGKTYADGVGWSFLTPSAVGTVTRYSSAAQDGWVLESRETSNAGSSMSAASAVIHVGDSATKSQYRGILSFKGNLPAGAVITSATLKICKAGIVGRDPFNSLGKLVADLKKGSFGNNVALQATDFQASVAPVGRNAAMTFSSFLVGGCYSSSLNPAYLTYIDPTGITQVRLRFAKDDDNDLVGDYLKIYSGSYGPPSKRPQLTLVYYVP